MDFCCLQLKFASAPNLKALFQTVCLCVKIFESAHSKEPNSEKPKSFQVWIHFYSD